MRWFKSNQACLVPAAIKVGPHTYTVITDPKILHSHGVDYGMTKLVENEIYCNTEIAESQVQDTLLHETLHAVIGLLGLAGFEEALINNEELLVRSLAPVILLVLQENPELVEFLTTPS